MAPSRKRPSRGLRGEDGMALVSILMILGALTVLSVGLMVFSTTEVQIADNNKNHSSALFVAEAGIAEIVARLDLPVGNMVTVNGSTFDASIVDDDLDPDPTWRTEVYLAPATGLPAPAGTETIVPTVQPSANWLEYADPGQGLDPITVEHKWIDLDADGLREDGELVLYDGSRFPPENFATGFPIEVVTVPAIVNGSRRTVVTELVRIPLNAQVSAAISTDFTADLTGNMTGCGHNHNLNTPTGTQIPGCQAFEDCVNRSIDAAAGCLFGVVTTGDNVATGGASDLAGFPSWSDTSSTNVFHDIQNLLGLSNAEWSAVQNNPDYTSANDAVNMDGIVIVQWDATGSETFNGNVGTGLLYVDGDLDISGNFVWRGLIYAEGDIVVTGTAWVLGALVARGSSSTDAFAAGNSTVLYSSEAIRAYVGGQMSYQPIAWKEL